MITKKKILNTTESTYEVSHEVLLLNELLSVARSGKVYNVIIDYGLGANDVFISSLDCRHYYSLGKLRFGIAFDIGEKLNIVYKTQI